MDRVSSDEDFAVDAEDEVSRTEQAKMRHCLRCRTMFLSEWSGERICRKCKSTLAWRQG